MNGGDPILGGGQANPNPGNTQSTPPGPQPAPSADVTASPVQAPFQSPASPAQSSTPLISQTFSSNDANTDTPSTSPATRLGQPFAASSYRPQQPRQSSYHSMQFTGPASQNNSYSQDITLPSAAPAGKSKKRIAIVLIILIIIIASAVGLCVFLNQKKNISVAENKDNAQAALNRYSNYLLYQTESDAAIGGNASWSNDKILENLAINDNNAKVAYFDKLIELFNTFSDDYGKIDKSQASSEYNNAQLITGIIENNKRALQALRFYAVTPIISGDDMATMYLKQGGDTMLEYVRNFYKDTDSSDNQRISDYGAIETRMADTIKMLYDEYNANGCIVGQLLDSVCVQGIQDETIIEKQTMLDDYNNGLDETEWHILNDAVKLSQGLQEYYYEGGENE